MEKIYIGKKFSNDLNNKLIKKIEEHNGLVTMNINDANVIIGEPDLKLIQDNEKLKWVQMTWAGTDKYTALVAKQNGGFPKDRVKLTNASGAFGVIMAEYAIGAILTVYRNFYSYKEQQKNKVWKDAGAEETLEGKRALLLGTGDIGSKVARRLKAFDVEVVGIRRSKDVIPDNFDKIYGFEDIDKVLPTADIVICSLPNKPNTRGLLTKQRLMLMKEDAVLLNMGRGTLMNLEDLQSVLDMGRLKAVILDVMDPEPLPENHPLWNYDNVVITPHIAGPSIGHSIKTEEKIIDICIENLDNYFEGRELKHVISENDFEY